MCKNLSWMIWIGILAFAMVAKSGAAQNLNQSEWSDPMSWFDREQYEYDERWDLHFDIDNDFDYIKQRYEVPEIEESWGDRDPDYDFNARQQALSGGRTQGEKSVRGEIESWKKFSLRDRQGRREVHTIAKITFQDGRTALIDLGRNENLLRTELQQGDQIVARGRTGTVNGRRVLMAKQVQLDGRSFNLTQGWEVPQNTGANTENRASFSGRVQEFRWTHLGGGDSGKAFAHVGLEDGRSMLVDLGIRGELEELDVSRDDLIRVLGWRDSAQGRPILRANQLWVNGRRRYIRNADAGGPWGVGTAAGSQRGESNIQDRERNRTSQAQDNQTDQYRQRELSRPSDRKRTEPNERQGRRSDDEVLYDVLREFRYAPEVDSSEINVQVNGGTVILKGDVETAEASRMATMLAREVPGVLRVQNQLRVSDLETLPAETLTRRVRNALSDVDQLNTARINVDARTGRVFLRGEVGSYAERARAEQLASEVPGVWGVVNELRVRPSLPE